MNSPNKNTSDTGGRATELDVIVIGSGFSGSVFAVKAAQMGLAIKVFDAKEHYPNVFRADKLEQDQYEILEDLELTDLLEPKQSPFIDEVFVYRGSNVQIKPQSKHRGLDYGGTVNSLRDPLLEHDKLVIKNIVNVTPTRNGYQLAIDETEIYQSRLLVIATGVSRVLLNSLGIVDQKATKLDSTSFGFYVKADSPSGFTHEAFNFRPDKFVYGLDFATFFRIGDALRVNVFTFWPAKSKEALEFRKHPKDQIHRYFPSLKNKVGDFSLTSPLQVFTTTYYRKQCAHLNNLVLIGDAFQSVCPATGMGLSKCLTDVAVLLDLVKKWHVSGKNEFQSKKFYDNARKRKVDDEALDSWSWANERATSRSFGTQLRHLREAFRKSSFRKFTRKLIK